MKLLRDSMRHQTPLIVLNGPLVISCFESFSAGMSFSYKAIILDELNWDHNYRRLNSLKGRTTFGMNLRKKFYLLHKADS
jgi:hypothetical protein